ncbi:MAG: hypothetical protein CSA21_06280 [Deltaproteobacteria bacterium]|nr:MAG: hypothetical protein CSA21_06280 [Deltaproteobacteria bacterium]
MREKHRKHLHWVDARCLDWKLLYLLVMTREMRCLCWQRWIREHIWGLKFGRVCTMILLLLPDRGHRYPLNNTISQAVHTASFLRGRQGLPQVSTKTLALGNPAPSPGERPGLLDVATS